jgi:hypothetical protein
MISSLSSAKSFNDENRSIQLNTIKSWLAVSTEVEVILYGHSEGAKEVSSTLSIKYVPEIESTPDGVPYFNAIADHAKYHARYDT